MAQYPFKVNYVDIKGMEGQDMAVLRVEDATNTNVVFEVYPRGRANFVNYSNDTAFTIMQTKTNHAALRLYIPASHSSVAFDISSSGPTTSTFINVTSGGSDVFKVTTNETTVGNTQAYGSFILQGGNGSSSDYIRLYSDGNTSGMIEMRNIDTGHTYCKVQPNGGASTPYYLYTKNAQTSGFLLEIGSYQTRRFAVDYLGSVYFNNLLVDSISAQTVNGNLSLSANGSGIITTAYRISGTQFHSTYTGGFSVTMSAHNGGASIAATTPLSTQYLSIVHNTNAIMTFSYDNWIFANRPIRCPQWSTAPGTYEIAANRITSYDTNANLTLWGNGSGIVKVDDNLVVTEGITIGAVSSPTDVTANGKGITLKGTTDKTILWNDSYDSWMFNQGLRAIGNSYFTGTSPTTEDMYFSIINTGGSYKSILGIQSGTTSQIVNYSQYNTNGLNISSIISEAQSAGGTVQYTHIQSYILSASLAWAGKLILSANSGGGAVGSSIVINDTQGNILANGGFAINGALTVDSITSRTTSTNLTLSGNGTGYVIVNDRLEVVGSIKTSNPNGGTAAEWKLGSIVTATVALDTTQYLQVDVGGTLYKVAIVS